LLTINPSSSKRLRIFQLRLGVALIPGHHGTPGKRPSVDVCLLEALQNAAVLHPDGGYGFGFINESFFGFNLTEISVNVH
jgi:hypothetical protein